MITSKRVLHPWALLPIWFLCKNREFVAKKAASALLDWEGIYHAENCIVDHIKRALALSCANVMVAGASRCSILFVARHGDLHIALVFATRAYFGIRLSSSEEQNNEKKLKSDLFLEKIFMVRLCRNAKRGGLYLWVCWLMNILNIFSALVATIGAVGAVITHADGWTGCLLLIPPLGCLLGATALLFIPDLICLPSERKRYRWK